MEYVGVFSLLGILLGLLLLFGVNILFGVLMNNVAHKKGHTGSGVFWLVFFFGIFGVLYAIALPDLVAQRQREDLLAVLLKKGG